MEDISEMFENIDFGAVCKELSSRISNGDFDDSPLSGSWISLSKKSASSGQWIIPREGKNHLVLDIGTKKMIGLRFPLSLADFGYNRFNVKDLVDELICFFCPSI